jgi:sterol desaturase/sphingolipid hydroxylase (fatty acid hydroxylase superfamily)
VFAYRRHSKSIFEQSPVAYRIGGIPVLSILGVLAAAFVAYLTYLFILDPFAGATSTPSLVAITIGLLAAIAIYFGAYAYRKKQGIDLNLLFREIPVE